MAGFSSGMVLTDAGRELMTRLVAEQKPILLTHAVYGSGTLPAGTDIHTVTAVLEPKLDMPVVSREVLGNGTASVTMIVDNASVAAPGFEAREVGVYAQYGDKEILYSYSYFGDQYEYIPSPGGPIVVNKILTIYVIIGRITQVELSVSSNLAVVTQEEFQKHLQECAKGPQFGDPFGEEIEASAVKHIWADSGDGKLHKAPVPLLQKVVLGSDWANIRTYNSRLEQVEREQANLILEAELRGEYPDMNEAFAEVFIDSATVDRFSCAVSSIVAGDDSIDVDNLSGVVPGAYYTISDGANQELVKIRSCTKAEGIHRIILAAPVVHTYAANTAMYRTTARLGAGQAMGSGTKKTVVWQPALVWQGLNASAAITVTMETTQAHAESFLMDGDIGFTADGMVTLV